MSMAASTTISFSSSSSSSLLLPPLPRMLPLLLRLLSVGSRCNRRDSGWPVVTLVGISPISVNNLGSGRGVANASGCHAWYRNNCEVLRSFNEGLDNDRSLHEWFMVGDWLPWPALARADAFLTCTLLPWLRACTICNDPLEMLRFISLESYAGTWLGA